MKTMTPHRTAVVRALIEAGGSLEDASGLVAGKLREKTGHKTTQALSGVLQSMEDAGLIRREMAGRRTFKIELNRAALEAGDFGDLGLADQDEPPVVEVADEAGPLDYDALAGALLKQAVQALTKNEGADTLLRRQYLATLRAADVLKDELGAVKAQLAERSEALLTANTTIKALENNLKVFKAQADKPAHREGVPIKDRITAEERRALDKLMRETPGTR